MARVSNPLRAGLAGALAVLLLACVAVSQIGGRAATVAVVAPPVLPVPNGSPPPTPGSAPQRASHQPTTLIRPAPSDPPPARSQVTPACGLSLDPKAPVVAPGSCTVIEVGDSIGADLGYGLGRHLQPGSGVQLVQLDRASTGLANTAFWDWPVALTSYLQRYHPQLVIICLGGNDQQGIAADGSGMAFATPAWQSVYLARVQEMISASTDSGAYVLWVGLPMMQQPSFNEGAAYLDGLYALAVAGSRHAAFVPMWSLFASAKGGYAPDAQVNGTHASLRDPDGIHLSYTGEDVAATYVIEQLAQILHVSLVAADAAVVTARY